MNAIRWIPIPRELFWDSKEEEIVAAVAARGYEPEAMEEEYGEGDYYVDQEELEEMEMESEEL